MGTKLTVWADQKTPTPTPELTKSLSPQEVEGHRAKIASEVRAVLSAYFQPHEDEAIKAMQLAWWCDELEDWTHEQVVWALRDWNRKEPRKRPTPGDILAILKATRGRKMAERAKPIPQQEQPSEEITEEDRERRRKVAEELGLKGWMNKGDE